MSQPQHETKAKKLKNSYLAGIVIFFICLFNVAVFRNVAHANGIVWVSSAGAFISLLALVLLSTRSKKKD